MDLEFLSKGSNERLNRICELKKCNQEEALEFAISAGWLAAEKLEMQQQERAKRKRR